MPERWCLVGTPAFLRRLHRDPSQTMPCDRVDDNNYSVTNSYSDIAYFLMALTEVNELSKSKQVPLFRIGA